MSGSQLPLQAEADSRVSRSVGDISSVDEGGKDGFDGALISSRFLAVVLMRGMVFGLWIVSC